MKNKTIVLTRPPPNSEFFRYKYPRLSPGVLISMPYMISLVFAPVFGLIIDKLKYRVVWVCAGLVISSSAFVMMSVTLLNPYIPMTMLGFAYSIVVCTLWPMVAMLIPARQLGTAYGFLQALQNVFLTLLPPVYGYLFDHIGYMWMLVTRECFWFSFATVNRAHRLGSASL